MAYSAPWNAPKRKTPSVPFIEPVKAPEAVVEPVVEPVKKASKKVVEPEVVVEVAPEVVVTEPAAEELPVEE